MCIQDGIQRELQKKLGFRTRYVIFAGSRAIPDGTVHNATDGMTTMIVVTAEAEASGELGGGDEGSVGVGDLTVDPL